MVRREGEVSFDTRGCVEIQIEQLHLVGRRRSKFLISQFEASPDLVTMENVPQLLDHRVFAEFRSSLAGYHVWYAVIDCAEYGVPQNRKRLVLLASRIGPIALRAPDSKTGKTTVRNAISHFRNLLPDPLILVIVCIPHADSAS
jgi:C-5 cytosine-specific DNA methylase